MNVKLEHFDRYIKINNLEQARQIINILGITDEFNNYLENIFHEYLTKRINNLKVYNVKSNTVIVGLKVNYLMNYQNYEKGPLQGKDASEFKKKWGDIVKLQHIDGKLRYAVVWEENDIIGHIIDFIMINKLNMKKYYSQISDSLITSTVNIVEKNVLNARSEHHFKSLEMLEKLLIKNIVKLPVNIIEIKPIGSYFCETNIHKPDISYLNRKYDMSLSAADDNDFLRVGLKLERNGKWPDEVEAFENAKVLYISQLYTYLMKRKVKCIMMTDGTIMIFINGYMFNCHMIINKEILNFTHDYQKYKLANEITGDLSIISRKRKKNRTNRAFRKTNKSQFDLIHKYSKKHRQCFMDSFLSIQFHSFLKSVCDKLGFIYRRTCRLVKCWLVDWYIRIINENNHDIYLCYKRPDYDQGEYQSGECITENAIELLVAYVFTDDGNRVPQSVLGAFIRFLELLINHDWLKQPIVINVNKLQGADNLESYALSEELKIMMDNENLRQINLPAMVLPTFNNELGDHWTSQGPNPIYLARIQLYAQYAYDIITNSIIDSNNFQLQNAFNPDKSYYDCFIHLYHKIDYSKIESDKDFHLSIAYQKRSALYIAKEIKIQHSQCINVDINPLKPHVIALKWIDDEIGKQNLKQILSSIYAIGSDFIEKFEILQ